MNKSLALLLTNIKFFVSRLSRREKVIFYVCLIVAVVILFYVTIAEPMINDWDRTKKEIVKKKIELERYGKKTKKDNETMEQIKPVIEKVKWQVPRAEFQSVLLARVEGMAKDSGIKIVNMKFLSDKEFDFYRELSTEVKIECSLGSLTKFLYSLQNIPQILDVRKLELKPKDKESKVLQGELLIATISFEG
ncbi:MAG: type 4a pilus biogenesis protein PilO [Candidatus Omnitrophica bacterium]|nr:type 4a pilus biogenesis protein PilO [Candidatus Omnitrophota bacterium]